MMELSQRKILLNSRLGMRQLRMEVLLVLMIFLKILKESTVGLLSLKMLAMKLDKLVSINVQLKLTIRSNAKAGHNKKVFLHLIVKFAILYIKKTIRAVLDMELQSSWADTACQTLTKSLRS